MEVHPYFSQKPLIELCHSYDIVVTAYGPLGRPGLSQDPENDPILLNDPKIQELASKYDRSIAQILLRYLVIQVDAMIWLLFKLQTLTRVDSVIEDDLTHSSPWSKHLCFSCRCMSTDDAGIAGHPEVVQPSSNRRELGLTRFRPPSRGHVPHSWPKSRSPLPKKYVGQSPPPLSLSHTVLTFENWFAIALGFCVEKYTDTKEIIQSLIPRIERQLAIMRIMSCLETDAYLPISPFSVHNRTS